MFCLFSRLLQKVPSFVVFRQNCLLDKLIYLDDGVNKRKIDTKKIRESQFICQSISRVLDRILCLGFSQLSFSSWDVMRCNPLIRRPSYPDLGIGLNGDFVELPRYCILIFVSALDPFIYHVIKESKIGN